MATVVSISRAEFLQYDRRMKKLLPFLALSFLVCLGAPARAADVNAELAHRVAFGSANDVAILLDHGADANQVTDAGMTLATTAAMRADGQALPIIEKLVAAGADLNKGGPAEQYPVIVAARSNNFELMKFLVDHNVDFAKTDRNGATADSIAEYNNNQEILGLLSELKAKKEAEQAARRSPERQAEFYNKLVFEYCALQYLSYYVKSGQDKLSAEEGQIILSEENGKVRDILTTMGQDFGMGSDQFEAMRMDVQGKVAKELDVMISNRNRKSHNVGKPSDMNERCNRIGKKWLTTAGAQSGSPAGATPAVMPQ